MTDLSELISFAAASFYKEEGMGYLSNLGRFQSVKKSTEDILKYSRLLKIDENSFHPCELSEQVSLNLIHRFSAKAPVGTCPSSQIGIRT